MGCKACATGISQPRTRNITRIYTKTPQWPSTRPTRWWTGVGSSTNGRFSGAGSWAVRVFRRRGFRLYGGSDNHAERLVFREIGYRPIIHGLHAISVVDQRKQVYKQPHQPSKPAI